MGILYREDIFQKYKLPVPTTWAQFAQEAVALHKANPKIFITDFPASDGGWFTSLVWQAGSQPFAVNGTNIKININDAAAVQVANFWGNLIKQGVLDTEADFATDWYGGLSNGTIASWIAAPPRRRVCGEQPRCHNGRRERMPLLTGGDQRMR
jgi:multiple sugar transport system substrate-binding protein